jgi:hypothetical protein
MKFCGKNVLCEKGDEITRFDGSVGPLLGEIVLCILRLRRMKNFQ